MCRSRSWIWLVVLVLVGGVLGADGEARAQAPKFDLERAFGSELAKRCFEGDAAAVARLLDQGADPNSAGFGGVGSVLDLAVGRRNAKIVQLLLDHGANPNTSSWHGQSPVSVAAGHADTTILRMLFKAGAKPTGEAFGAACMRGNRDAVNLFLEKGAEPTQGLCSAAYRKDSDILLLVSCPNLIFGCHCWLAQQCRAMRTILNPKF